MKLFIAALSGLALLQTCEGAIRTARAVNVYVLDSGNSLICLHAMQRARLILREAGVDLRFRPGSPRPGETPAPVVVRIVPEAPTDQIAPTLAKAYPYEGSRIDIYYNRVLRHSADHTTARLAYVMVHEITHILQGIARHSSQGIMKAAWDEDDEYAIACNKLRFAEEDLTLLRLGLEERARKDEQLKLSAGR